MTVFKPLLAATLLLTALPALAQTSVAVNEQAFAGRATPATPDPNDDPASAFLTGDGDLLLLGDTKHLTVRSVTDWLYTNNALLTNDNRVSDTYSRQEFAVRADTRVDNTWDLFAEGGVIFTEFVDEDQLSSDTLFARVGGSTAYKGGTLGGTVTGNFIHNEGFSDELITQLVLTGFYLKSYQLNADWLLSTRLIASRTWADPHDFTNTRFTAGADLITPVCENVAWVSGVDLYAAWYDDFFGNSPGVNANRRDLGFRARTELHWNVHENAALRAGLGYNFQDSTVSFLDYDELTLGATLRLTLNF